MAASAEEIPATMRAVRKTTAGVGFTIEESVPVPSPEPGSVLLKVLACSLCGTDVHVHEWDPPFSEGRLVPPVTTGHEVCGRVVALGEGVDALAVGDLVSAESHIPCASQPGRAGQPPCGMCATGNAHICEHVQFFSVDVDGFLAEYAVAPANILWRHAPDVDVEIAALFESLGNSVYTVAESAVEGKSVVVFGCGPTGLNSIAVAAVMGAAQVIAVAGSAHHMSLAREMGATTVLNRHEVDVEAEVRRLTGGSGADVCLEMSGAGSALETALKAVRCTGMVTILGLYAAPLTLDWSKLIVLKDITVRGIYGRRIWSTWELTASLIGERGLNVRPVISHRFDALDDFTTAVALMKAGECGKCMIFPHGRP